MLDIRSVQVADVYCSRWAPVDRAVHWRSGGGSTRVVNDNIAIDRQVAARHISDFNYLRWQALGFSWICDDLHVAAINIGNFDCSRWKMSGSSRIFGDVDVAAAYVGNRNRFDFRISSTRKRCDRTVWIVDRDDIADVNVWTKYVGNVEHLQKARMSS